MGLCNFGYEKSFHFLRKFGQVSHYNWFQSKCRWPFLFDGLHLLNYDYMNNGLVFNTKG